MKNDSNTNDGAKGANSLEASKKVADILRRIMVDRNITQSAMAEFAETSTSQFSRMINGKLEFSLQHIANIANRLNMEIEELFAYKKGKANEKESSDTDTEPTEVLFQVKLRKDKKDQAMRLIFGDNYLEIFNK